jgi:hypothetical protein
MEGMGEAGRPPEIEGFPHNQGNPWVHVGPEGLGKRHATYLAGQAPATLFDPAIPQADAPLPVHHDQAHVHAIRKEVAAVHQTRSPVS